VIPTANQSLNFKISPSDRRLPAVLHYFDFVGEGAPAIAASSFTFLRSDVDSRKRMKESKDIQKPQHYGDDDDAIQN
jgi:hypothetical protein